jgi:hypothetical protein
VSAGIVQLRPVPTAEEFATFTYREALLAILTDARTLEHARQLAGQAVVDADGELSK